MKTSGPAQPRSPAGARAPRARAAWRAFAASVLLLLAAAPAPAHDFWIVPSRFIVQPGQVLGVSLRVGEHLSGERVPRVQGAFQRFVVVRDGLAAAVSGREGADPAGALRPSAPGLHVIAYESHSTPIELPAATFNDYLRIEGLQAIAGERERRGQGDAPARERYTRCAKAHVMVGSDGHAVPEAPQAPEAPEAPLGLTLELVAEGDLYAQRREGEPMSFRLLYLGQPLPGALVMGLNAAAPTQPQSQRSDAAGRVRFALAGDGLWLIKVVHMVEAPPGSDVQWVSYWASLTFERKRLTGAGS
jgi:uncharacterized GH25 family protein